MRPAPGWVSVQVAADYLGLGHAALRRTLERRAARVADGGTEANVDGVRARKFGRLWRVQFSASWLLPAGPHDTLPPSPERSGMPERKPA
jgi:hypothetical protein